MTQNTPLACFKAYDIRGQVPEQLNVELAHRIGQAFAKHFNSKKVVVGYDIRLTSLEMKEALVAGLLHQGADVIDIGLCGTEMVYFATANLEKEGVDGGIMITASHNPADYNGMKLVGQNAVPVSGDSGLFDIEKSARLDAFAASLSPGQIETRDVMAPYVDHLLSYVEPASLTPLKIVSNPGNGGAGLVIDAISSALPFEWLKVHHEADGRFPNGVPNPLLEENRAPTVSAIQSEGADLGLAWDGDFDRCFFFDEKGGFVDGYYMVGLLAAEMLRNAPGESILYDPRLTWNTIQVVKEAGGNPLCCKTGHAFIKERMRAENAIYGGEMSAHHYFRDFSYCDSGMIPWLLCADIMSRTGQSLSSLVEERMRAFPASGEINLRLEDADAALQHIQKLYQPEAQEMDTIDGLSFSFGQWRFNLRKSNTEPVVRLNVESKGNVQLMQEKTEEVLTHLRNTPSA
jgi:phosphomannomutase